MITDPGVVSVLFSHLVQGECCFHKSKMVVQLLSFYFQRLCQQYSQCVVFRQRFIFLSFPWKKVWKKELFLLYRKFYFGFKSFFFHWILLHICLMGFWLSFDRLLSSGLIQNCETPDVPENLGEHGYSSAKSCSGFRGNLILNVLLSPICILCFYFYSSQTLYKGEWQ